MNRDRSYAQRSEVFAVHVDNGARISASACQLVGVPTLEVIKPVPTFACASQHLKGWQLSARFQHPATGLTIQWRAELRDGSHYVRQLLRVEGDKGKLTEVNCLEASVGKAWNEGTALAGNPVCSDNFFMGQELPMSKNVALGSGEPDKWGPSDMQTKAVNRKIKDLQWDKAGDGASPHFMALPECARELRQVDPNLFFNVTVGTWPSPFWLNVIDSTWRGGEDVNWDWECKGNDREKWLNYRDGVTYQGVVKVAPLYPLNSIIRGDCIGVEANRSADPAAYRSVYEPSPENRAMKSLYFSRGIRKLHPSNPA